MTVKWMFALAIALTGAAAGAALYVNSLRACACMPMIVDQDGTVVDAGVAASPDCGC